MGKQSIHKKVNKIEKEIYIHSEATEDLKDNAFDKNKSIPDAMESSLQAVHEGTERILKEVARANNEQVMDAYHRTYKYDRTKKKVNKKDSQFQSVNLY